MWLIEINGEDPITVQGTLDEINFHQTSHLKSKVIISLWKSKSYHIIDIEEIWSGFDQVRPVVSYIEVCLPKKTLTPKNIDECLKGPQRQHWKEDLFVQYGRNKNFSLILAPIPIKSLPEGRKVLHSLICTIIMEGECSDASNFVAHHYVNGSYHIKVNDFDNSYSPVAHDDPFIINIAIAAMNILTSRFLDFINAFQNNNVPINERICVSPLTYYLDWFKRYYPNVPLNWYYGSFFLQCMNVIQGVKPVRLQCNILLDTVFAILKYNKMPVYHDIYIKETLVEGCFCVYLSEWKYKITPWWWYISHNLIK